MDMVLGMQVEFHVSDLKMTIANPPVLEEVRWAAYFANQQKDHRFTMQTEQIRRRGVVHRGVLAGFQHSGRQRGYILT